MKKIIQMTLAFVSIPLLMGAVKHGGHVGNGGDIRRFRAHSATKSFIHEVARFHQAVQTPKCQSKFEAIDPQLIKKSDEMVQWSNRMVNTWVDDDSQKSCLNFEKRTSDIKLTFSFDQCVTPTPRDYYSDLITSSFLKAFATPDDLNPLTTIDQFRELNNSCLGVELKDVSPYYIYTPASFVDNSSTLSILENGRRYALMALSKLNSSTVRTDKTLSAPIANFLSHSLEKLILEVEKSKYVIGNDANTCGLTQLTSQAPIYFSLANCSDLKSDRDVAWIIIHESTHHLGVDSENFADRVATEVVSRVP